MTACVHQVADEVVDFVGDAEILVTQLAPLSEGMMRRLPDLKLVAVSRGGPINIDMAAARAHGVTVVNVPGRNATAVVIAARGQPVKQPRAWQGRRRRRCGRTPRRKSRHREAGHR